MYNRAMGNYTIVSSDCHAGPRADRYREYPDPQCRDRYDDGGNQASWDPDLALVREHRP